MHRRRNALRPAPARMQFRRRVVPHRTGYVCASFAIDRFGAFASQTVASVRKNSRVAAGDPWRAALWPTFSSRVGLPSSAFVRPSEGSEKQRATTVHMMNSRTIVESLSSSDLRSATHKLVRRSHGLDAELLVHLGEIDERKLYLDWTFSSMFAFCVGELRFSEDVACNRIDLARAARRMPVILEALRSGQVHLAGLRVLAPHLTPDNQERVLAEAAGKSKRQVEELVARLWPQPPVPTVVRKLPGRPNPPSEASPAFSFGAAIPVAQPESLPALAFAAPPAPPPRRDERAVIAPLSEETFKFQFTGSRACHDKFRQAQDLLRHRIPDGDLATIVEKALDLLIEQVKKERFATERKGSACSAGRTTNTPRTRCTVARSWNERAHRSTGLQPRTGFRQGECRTYPRRGGTRCVTSCPAAVAAERSACETHRRSRLVRRVERAWEVREERPTRPVDDRDHVEPGAPRRTPPAGEEVARRPHQPLLFGGADRLLRSAESGGAARAHLDEDEEISLLRDQVHLAARAAVLARHDPVPARREQLLGGLLAQVAQALARSAHAWTTRSAVPCGGSSAVRWMICVWAAMPFSILATSARLAGSRAENASSTTTGSRLYAATRSSSARRSAAYARSFSAGGRPWYGPLRPSALESTQCRFSSVVLDTMRLSVSADR